MMNIKGINRQVKDGRVYIKAFLGAKSTKVDHYLKNIAMTQLSYMSELMTY